MTTYIPTICTKMSQILAVCHAYEWQAEDYQGRVEIRGWCISQTNQSVLVRIRDFDASCYVELPSGYSWTGNTLASLVRALESKATVPFASHSIEQRTKLYHYNPKTQAFLLCSFRCIRDLDLFLNNVRGRSVKLAAGSFVGPIKVFEDKITVVRKFLTAVKFKYSQWFQVPAKPVVDSVSILENEYLVSYKDLVPLVLNHQSQPKLLVFDIECYSHNHRAIPEPLFIADSVKSIGILSQRLGDPSTQLRDVVTIPDANTVEGVTIHKVKTEKDLLLKFCQILASRDPDVVINHNLYRFDYPYLNTRYGLFAKEGETKWPCLSRIKGRPGIFPEKPISWGSSANRFNQYWILQMDGRISIDTDPLIRRTHPKLPRYSLDALSMQFLKESKRDIKPQEMFRLWELAAKATTPEESAASKREMAQIVDYNIQDCHLVIRLAEKLHLWGYVIKMSNCMGVSPVDTYTRGQQIRCLSQIYDAAHLSRYVIEFGKESSNPYPGAIVVTPVPGIYRYIIWLDFSSMYPSIIQAYNICYTTHLQGNDHLRLDKEDYWEIETEEGTIRFVKKHLLEGLVPLIAKNGVAYRNEVKDVWKTVNQEADPILWTSLNNEQEGVKMLTNSFYGNFGTQDKGRLPLRDAGYIITKIGTQLLRKTIEHVQTKYNGQIIYGDSVVDSTPVLVRLDGTVSWVCIKDIHPFAKSRSKVRVEVEGLEVWSDQGWTRVRAIICHRCIKQVYRVTTCSGQVEVTQDHSLILQDGKSVRPLDLKVGDLLLHSPLPNVMASYSKGTENAMLFHALGGSFDERGVYQSDPSPTPNKVLQIIGVPYSGYVYDLETFNHHFSAGVGNIVVHNTDSVAVHIESLDPKKICEFGRSLAKEISALFPPPVAIAFEKAAYRLCMVAKKKYFALCLDDKTAEIKKDKEGKYVILDRGTPQAKRGHCKWLQRVYSQMRDLILWDKTYSDTFEMLVDEVYALVSGVVPWQDMVLIQELGGQYKQEGYFMNVFADGLRASGESVTPGDRLEYVIVEGQGKKGTKMRLRENYKPEQDKIDYIYYLEHQSEIDRAFFAAYANTIEPVAHIGYRPVRRQLVLCHHPVHMLVAMLKDGKDVRKARDWLRNPVPKTYPLIVRDKKVVKGPTQRELLN